MANHASALKRARQNVVRRLRNKIYKTHAKTVGKEVAGAVADNSMDEARARLCTAVSIIQKTASKGVIHKNKAARKVARLARRVNRMTSGSPA